MKNGIPILPWVNDPKLKKTQKVLADVGNCLGVENVILLGRSSSLR
jgi:hypothetical protein